MRLPGREGLHRGGRRCGWELCGEGGGSWGQESDVVVVVFVVVVVVVVVFVVVFVVFLLLISFFFCRNCKYINWLHRRR